MTDAPEPHAVGRHQLGPHVVGQRIVVRHLLRDGRATDVLGTCVSWSDTELVVDRDGAGPVAIRIADVVTGKPVPPRASVRDRVSAREAEGHGLGVFANMERVDLGDWVLRSCPPAPGDRLRKRANSALAMGDAGRPLTHATNAVLSFYEQRGQTPMVQVQAGSSCERWFTSTLGWSTVPGADAHFQVAPISRALRSAGRGVDEMRLTESGTSCIVEHADGPTLARGAAYLDGDWLGLHHIVVDSAHRRRGLGTAVVADLLDWGASLGASTAWLHVQADNHAGLAAYARLGFVTHHTNRYLAAM